MKRLLLALLAALALPTACSNVEFSDKTVNAEISDKIHKRCKDAKDYLGCVKAMTTKSSDIPKLKLIEGAKELSGNSCPIGFAYAGAGMCREVLQKFTGVLNVRHVALLSAGYGARKERWLFGETSNELFFGQSTKAVLNPNCPKREPYLYRNSSCEPKLSPIDPKELKKIVRTLKKKDVAGWDAALYQLFGVDNLATDALNYKKTKSTPNKESSVGSVKINCDSAVWKNKPICN